MKAHEIVEGVLATVGFTTIVGGIAICTANAVQKHKKPAKPETEIAENDIEEEEE